MCHGKDRAGACKYLTVRMARVGPTNTMELKELIKITSLSVAVASLCCIVPFILVALGLSSVSFATSLADTLYGEYKWLFRVLGLVFLGISVAFYLRRSKNACTLDDLKRRRNELLNVVALATISGVAGYLLFLYGVVYYAGVWYRIWE